MHDQASGAALAGELTTADGGSRVIPRTWRRFPTGPPGSLAVGIATLRSGRSGAVVPIMLGPVSLTVWMLGLR